MSFNRILNFLETLSQNNTREWFENNRSEYLENKEFFEAIVQELLENIKKFDSTITLKSYKEAVFRIYRDVRFSKNKAPFKTNFGAFITKGGKSGNFGGYYLHIEPKNIFLAGGAYMPDAATLKAIRNEIYDYPLNFKNIIFNKCFIENFGVLQGEKLKKAPKDFPQDFELIEYLKHKSFLMMHPLQTDDLQKKDLMKYMLKIFEAMMPLNHFINNSIQNIENHNIDIII